MNKEIIKNLAKIESNKKVDAILMKLANKIDASIKKPGNEAEIYSQLELLEAFSHRVPDQTLNIVKFIFENKCRNEFYDKNWINYGTVSSKCFELLKGIRYLKTEEIFDLLTSLKFENDKIKEARNETLKKLLQYNYNVLKQIGLTVQRVILNKMNKWNKKEKVKNIDVIKIAAKEFLQPSYEWSNMIEWNKLQFSSGSLVGDKKGNLAKIRKEIIDLVLDVYNLTKNNKEKLDSIRVLDEASRTSHSGTDESLEKIIKENISFLIKEYQEITFDKKDKVICSLPVAMEIERQLLWFVKRWPKEERETMDRFIIKLNNDERYSIYGALVDRARMDYLKDKEEDKLNKDDLIDKVSANKKWLKIFSDIAEASLTEEDWKFHDFISFLEEIAERKPETGEYLIDDAIKNNTALVKFSGGILLGFRKINKLELWDKYVSKLEDKKKSDLILRIILSLITYFKSTEDSKFRDKDLTWIKNLINKRGKYKFLKTEKNKNPNLEYNLFAILLVIWKYETKEIEKMIISELKNTDGNLSTHKLERLEMAIDWKELDITAWDKSNLNVLADKLVESKNFDYHDQHLIIRLGEIDFAYVMKVLEGRLNQIGKTRKDKEYYDAIPTHLESELQSLIVKNESKFRKSIINLIDKKKPSDFSFYYECGSLIRQLWNVYNDILDELMKQDSEDNFIKVLNMTRSVEGSNIELLFRIAEKIVSSKSVKNKKKRREFLSRINGIMYSTGMVSGEHGISTAHEGKVKEVIAIKDRMQKDKKPKELISFASDVIRSLKESAKREYLDEERQTKMMEIDFEK